MARYSNRLRYLSTQLLYAGVVLAIASLSQRTGYAQQYTAWPGPVPARAYRADAWPAVPSATGDVQPMIAERLPVTTTAGPVSQHLLQPAGPEVQPVGDEIEFISDQMAAHRHTHHVSPDCRQWQVAPEGLIYRSYLAGPKEPRMAARWLHRANQGWLWDVNMGGRMGLVRYGTTNAAKPEGWQVDVEGCAIGRLDLGAPSNALQATDYRVGVPLTYGRDNYQTKLAFYHVSSHLGDELMIQKPTVPRINYVRDAIVWGHSYYLHRDYRVYGEVGYAFGTDGGAEPWEFQFGAEYSPVGPTGAWPTLFWATNAHLREEVDFGGNLTFQVGLQWRGVNGQRMRFGMHYMTGQSEQFEFYDEYEDKIGFAFWYDF